MILYFKVLEKKIYNTMHLYKVKIELKLYYYTLSNWTEQTVVFWSIILSKERMHACSLCLVNRLYAGIHKTQFS